MAMENQLIAESLRVMEANGKLSNDGSLVLSDNAKEDETLEGVLLEDLDSYMEDITDRLTISRMVSDSVIKGMVNAVTQEAAERIAQKELEVARLRETLKLYQVGLDGNGFLGSPEVEHKLNSTEILVSCSCADAFPEKNKLATSLSSLRNVAGEQFKKLRKEIGKIKECGASRKMNSGSVGLSGILLEKVSKNWMDVDETLDSLKTTLDTVYKQVGEIGYMSKTSYEWQFEHDFRGEIEYTVIKECLQSVQKELEERLWDKNASLYSSGIAKWKEKIKEISNLRQELDAISKSFSAHEIGQLTPHGSFEIVEDWNHNKWTDNFHRSVSGDPTSLWDGNGKLEESITPESLDAAQLKHMTKDELVNYFKTEMTKMKRSFESREEMITDKYFSLRREYLKVKGSSLAPRKDKEFDMLRKKIPELISKLDDILVESEKLTTLGKDGESLICLKESFDALVLENNQLRNLLSDKEREVKSLSSQVYDAKEKISENFLAEEKLVKLVGDLKCDIEDALIQTSICEEVYSCLLREATCQIRCISEESEMESRIMREIYQVIFMQAAQNAEPAIKNGTADADVEFIIMQGLLEVMLVQALKEASEKFSMLDIRYTEENKIRLSREMHSLETEKALRLEIAEKDQEIYLLAASLGEKEKFVLEAEAGLGKVNEQFELALQELNNLKEQASQQQIIISEGSKELDVMKRELAKAWEQIELQKMEIGQLHQKIEQIELQKVENALSLVEVKEREYNLHKKQVESITVLIQRLSKLHADFECRVTEDIKKNSLRLESMSYQLNDVVQKANLVKRTGLAYKEKFDRRCSDLQKAEAEIIALHEAGRECVWLRSMIQHIQETCGLNKIKESSTILYEDNVACIAQIKGGCIKGDRTKHISPKFFSTHELQKNSEIDVHQIRSSENLGDLFTKSLPTKTFEQLARKIGLRRLRNVCSTEGET